MSHGHRIDVDDDHVIEEIVRALALILAAGAILGGLTSIVAIKIVDAALAAL
jgi:hypothetical protein